MSQNCPLASASRPAFAKTALLILILATLVLQGCASTKKWKVDAVEPSRKGVAVRSVTIEPFSGKGRETGTQFARVLAGHLDGQKFVEVRPQGAEGRVSGSLSGSRPKVETWRERYEYKGKMRTRYYAKLSVPMTASYTLSANGQTWSGTYTDEHTEEESSSDSYREAKAELNSPDVATGWVMHGLASRISQDITPFRVRKTYRLKLGDSDHLEIGADYAIIGREEQAMSIFKQVAERTSNDEDRAAAIYNMGVIHEVQGDFEKAFQAYRDASQFHLEELMYPKAVTRLEQEMDRHAAVNAQMEALSR